MKILLATNNEAKLAELRRIVAPLGAEVCSLADVPAYDEPVETSLTFLGNALIKARAGVHHTGLATLADDSGLCVQALRGMPGVLSSRWSGRGHTDEKNLQLVLEQLDDLDDEDRVASFVCEVALVLPDGREFSSRGEMPGRIVREPRGHHGFGYDPIFVADDQPDEGGLTNAELDAATKDSISHRGRALREMAQVIATIMEGDAS